MQGPVGIAKPLFMKPRVSRFLASFVLILLLTSSAGVAAGTVQKPRRSTIQTVSETLRMIGSFLSGNKYCGNVLDSIQPKIKTSFLRHKDFVRELNKINTTGVLRFSEGIRYSYPIEKLTDAFMQKIGLSSEQIAKIKENSAVPKENPIGLLGAPFAEVSYHFLALEKRLVLNIPSGLIQEPPTDFQSRTFLLDIMNSNNSEIGNIEIRETLTDQGNNFYITFVDVEPEHQGQGYGSLAMKALVSYFNSSSLPFDQLSLKTGSIMPYTALLYAKAGFDVSKDVAHELAKFLGMKPSDLVTHFLLDSTTEILEETSGNASFLGKAIKKADLAKVKNLRLDLHGMYYNKGNSGLKVIKADNHRKNATFQEIKEAYLKAHPDFDSP